MRRAARTDSNHKAIVQALRQAGCAVCDASRLGDGAPDLLVYRAPRFYFLEVKSARGRLTEAQTRFHVRFPVHVVRSVEEALNVMGIT